MHFAAVPAKPGNALLTPAASGDLSCCTQAPVHDAHNDVALDNALLCAGLPWSRGLPRKAKPGSLSRAALQ